MKITIGDDTTLGSNTYLLYKSVLLSDYYVRAVALETRGEESRYESIFDSL